MIPRLASAALAVLVAASPASGQAKKTANGMLYDVTVTAEGTPYTGTMTLAIASGKVTGDMHITVPTEITGKVAGTAKGGELRLDFPYRMVERACDGQIAISIGLPERKEAATGSAVIGQCGDPQAEKIHGTVELKPKAPERK